jgi:hypothetical protein
VSSDFAAKKVATLQDDQKSIQIYARQRCSHPTSAEEVLVHEIEFPLLQRGWVYQERYLSPRVLHFLNNELMWECNDMNACECGFDSKSNDKRAEKQEHMSLHLLVGSEGGFVQNTGVITIKPNNTLSWTASVLDSWKDKSPETLAPRLTSISRKTGLMSSGWKQIVEEYSGLRLSFHKDKSPAISGLARRLQQLRLGQYISGL